jgi:hypothetical protein
MTADEITQFLWEGEGDQKVMPRQLPLELFFKPVLTFLKLTGGTMTVTTRAKGVMNPTIVFAGVDDRTTIRCPAVVDGLYHFKMLFRYPIVETLNIFRAVCFKDIINCYHGDLLSSKR